MKMKLLSGAMALALVGCSEAGTDNRFDDDRAAEASSAAGAPDVGLTAAPGVAFSYAYAFRIDDDRIARVQEQHAAACEALGAARCRITGLRYRLIRESEVEAQLAFALDPALARQFGRDALASVEKAQGVLAEARIGGDDVGTQIGDSQRRSADLSGEVARIEARLAKGGLGDRERTELQEQLAGLRERLAGERTMRRDGEARLAMTPMVFDYVGTGGLPGIGYGNPFSDAANMLLRSGSLLLSFMLVVGAALLPWVAAGALLLLLWRSMPMRALRARLALQAKKAGSA